MKIKCPICKYEGDVKPEARGSNVVELLLWLFFLFPGIIYSCWRTGGFKLECPQCKNKNVIRDINEQPPLNKRMTPGAWTLIFILAIFVLIMFSSAF